MSKKEMLELAKALGVHIPKVDKLNKEELEALLKDQGGLPQDNNHTFFKPKKDITRSTTKEVKMKYDPEQELRRLMELEKVASSDDLLGAGEVSVPVGNTIIAHRVRNPSEMVELVTENALYKHLIVEEKWIKPEGGGKKRLIHKLVGLGDYDYPPVFPVNSPMFQKIVDGDMKVCIVSQRDQRNKLRKGQKGRIFEIFQGAAASAGYICIQPDYKRTELRIYYQTPEKLASFFNVTVEKIFASLDKLHKWVKLVDSPTKITVDDGRMVRFLYHEEPNNEYGKPVKDGSGYWNGQVQILKEDRVMWHGFSQFMQIRSHKESGILAKCNLCANKKLFRREAKRMQDLYNVRPTQYEMILNQHAIKFDGIGLEAGKIYEVELGKLLRIINARLKMGTSTLGAQLVAASSMPAMRNILEEHGILEAASRIKALAKGLPFAWIDLAKGYRKIDTNKFLELALCVKRKWGWRIPKLYNVHNRNLSFLESEWRSSISSVLVNTRSAYTYTDDRCDEAVKAWKEKTGEVVSFCILDKATEPNEGGFVASIKYPLHSAPCICSHKVLREDIFDDESPFVRGPEGGLGLSTLYERSVHGLDDDGDKVALFITDEYIPPTIDFSMAEEEEKTEKVVITSIEEATEYIKEMAKVAAAETVGIGQKDLAVRYALTYLHLHNVELTAEMSSLIGAMREGNIKGGVKGDKKGIKGPEMNTIESLEKGTLVEDTINWMSDISGVEIPQLSKHGELNKDNLAEVTHALVVKGAKCVSNKHSDKFLFRMLDLLPAYMAHKGDKTNVPWHNAFEILSEGIKPEYLAFDKGDHALLQVQYKESWNTIKASFAQWGPEELGYPFDLDMVVGFAEWLRAFYRNNRDSILADYRGIVDRETREILVVGDWDSEVRMRKFQRLNRAIRFILNGLQPHEKDLSSLKHPTVPDGIINRCLWFKEKSRESIAYLKFANIYIGSIDINARGKTGNSGELTRLFPAEAFVAARELYYDSTNRGKKEDRNPFLDLTRTLASEFDSQWMERTQKWLEKNPYGEEYVYPENDYEGFEEEEIIQEYLEDEED